MGVHSTYRGAGGISEHLILWPVWHVAGTHGNPGDLSDGGFILFLFPSLLSLKIKDLCSVCFLLRNTMRSNLLNWCNLV